jgi:DNA-binding NtrC family response regulator
MARSRTLLFVSSNHDLHQVLETLRSAYGFSLLTADKAREGFDLIKVAEPDCIIFDLRLLRNRHRAERVKERVKAAGMPVLFLSDSSTSGRHSDASRTSVSLEPIVKFVAEQSERLRGNPSRRSWYRFFNRAKIERA